MRKGTGTAKGDTIELLAISNVIDDCKRTKPLLVGSVKSNVSISFPQHLPLTNQALDRLDTSKALQASQASSSR